MKNKWLFLIFIFMGFILPVSAASKIDLDANKYEVKVGEEIVLSIKLNVEDTSLYAFLGKLNYDQNFFEVLTTDNFEEGENWSEIIYNPENKKFALMNKSGNAKEKLVQIHLRAKKEANSGKTIISLSNSETSNGKEDFKFETQEIEILVTKDGKNDEKNVLNVSNGQEDNSVKTRVINNLAYIIAFMVLLFVVILVCIKELRKENKENKKKIIGIVLILFTSSFLLLGGFLIYTLKSGDVNKDKQVDYQDAKDILEYLINIDKEQKEDLQNNSTTPNATNKTKFPLNNSDVNHDGQITIGDAATIIDKIPEKTNYNVILTANAVDNYYPQRNEEITVYFYSEVTPYINLNKVIVNGEEKELTKISNSEYSFKINVGPESGINNLNITEVVLENGKKVKTKCAVMVDVLKKKPEISNFVVDNKVEETIISFLLEDNENALKDGYFEIKKDQKSVLKEQIKNGANTFKTKLNSNEMYQFKIYGNYDLDTNELNNITDDKNTGTITLLEKDIEIKDAYNFQISTFDIPKKVTTNGLTFKFASSNDSKYKIEKIIIIDEANPNGAEYPVEFKNDEYFVALPKQTPGKHSFKIQKVVLYNGASFEINQQFEYTVIKEKPQIIIKKMEENIENNSLFVDFEINDKDNALDKLSIILKDASGKIIDEKEIQNTDTNVTFETREASKYIVEIVGDYILSEEESFKNKVLDQAELEACLRAKVTDVLLSTYYPAKNQEVRGDFTITTNKDVTITHIMVNGQKLSATKVSGKENTYQAIFSAGSTSGLMKAEIQKVYVSNIETVPTKENNLKDTLDVLKEKLYIENYKEDDDYANGSSTFTFDLVDNDNAMISAYAQVEEQKIEVKKGHNTITFENITKDKLLTFYLHATYDLDTNELNEITGESNYYENRKIYENVFDLQDHYDFEITDSKTWNEKEETKYFNKNEKINIAFTANHSKEIYPVKLIIDGKEYDFTKKENEYHVTIDGFKEAGVHSVKLNGIILNSGKTVEQDKEMKIEVLKDAPTIKSFDYNSDKDVVINISIQDNDNAIKGKSRVTITDEYKNVVFEKELNPNENVITLPKSTSEYYKVLVEADYDLDTNAFETGKNEFNNIVLLEEDIDINLRLLEMKDIKNVTLYKQSGEEVSEVAISDLKNLDNYYVKVEMNFLPTFYSKIKEYTTENNELKFILDYNDTVHYENNIKENGLEVSYGPIEDGKAKQMSLEKLIAEIKKNPNGKFKVNKDLDASAIYSGEAIFPVEFKGEIDFQGHTISNLSRPLFTKLTSAKISNLIIENASMTANGALTPTATNGTSINNVHIKNASITSPNESGTGSLVGLAEDSTFEYCSATNIVVGNKKRSGGMIGKMNRTTLKNSYVSGKVSSTADGSGGMVGETPSGCIVENVYSDIITTFSRETATNAGIIGWSQNVILKNSLSVAKTSYESNHGYRVYGSNLGGSSTNNYELDTSNLASNSSHKAINTVTIDKLKTTAFYTDTLSWSEDIWNFDNVSKGGYPTLKGIDPNSNIKKTPTTSGITIPDYERLLTLKDYQEEKEILYYNMSKIMPFYDAKYYVIDGNKFDNNHLLNQKIIKKIIAYDQEGKQVLGLAKTKEDKIHSIRILFQDNSSKIYTVKYRNSYDDVVNYHIDELDIHYNYENYMIDMDSNLVQTLLSKIENYDYVNDISLVTPETEVRNYTNNYAHVKENAYQFILNFLANNGNFTLTNEKVGAGKKILADLEADKTLEKVLYTYNYFDRFYNIEIGGMNVRDTMFFDSDILTNKLNSMLVTNILINSSSSERSTTVLDITYNNKFRPYTGMTIGPTIEYFIKYLTNEKYLNDPASWILDNFNGVIQEVQAIGRASKVRYRVWDHMKARELLILPILSYHGDNMYLLGAPSIIFEGSFEDYEKGGTKTREQKEQLVKDFATKVQSLYSSIGSIVNDNTINTLARKSHISYDRTIKPNEVTDPVRIAFNEVLDKWFKTALIGYASAYANGTDIYWSYAALSSYGIFTHETIHNQDGYLFLEGTGRRAGAGGEQFTNGIMTQNFGANDLIVNHTYNFGLTDDKATNLSTERINSRAKLDDLYKKMFEVFTTLEYLEGKAFLKLTPEEQSKVARVMTDNQTTASSNSATKEDFAAMNLQTLEDLWDHKIITSRSMGYVGNSTWYIAHNDNGTNGTVFKMQSFQMLGEFGYDGFVGYVGNRYGTDLKVIRGLTGDDNMTWKTYQMNRYKRTEENLKNIKFFNADELVNQMVTAMKLDAANNRGESSTSYQAILRKYIYGYIKRATNDFRTGGIYDSLSVIHVKTADEFVNALKDKEGANIVLDNNIDFSGYRSTTAIINKAFTGTVDGKGHKITGLSAPLFNTMVYSNIKNVTFENANIDFKSSYVGALAQVVKWSSIENVHLKNVTITSTTAKDSYAGGLAGYVTQSFVNDITYTTNVTANNNYAGGLFGKIEYGTISNTHGSNVTVSGRARVGGFAGHIANIYSLTENSVNADVNGTQSEVGGFAGMIETSEVSNSYSVGNTTGNNNVGGFAGWVTNSKITNSFSNMYTKSKIAGGSGGFIGVLDYNTTNASLISNSASFGRISNGYKFDGKSTNAVLESRYKNNFEFAPSIGMATTQKTGVDFTNKITLLDRKDLNESFFMNTLKWDSNIWDFTNVKTGGLPKLKGKDTNNITEVISRKKISTVEEFEKISEAPDEVYTITNDIDFSSYNKNTSIVTATFTGKIEGNGHTLKNLKNASLFDHFNGTVIDLNIRDFTYDKPASDYVVAFAKETYLATLKNMKFENITLNGRNNVAVVSGMDGKNGANSTFEQISVKNANVKGTGVYISPFVGRKYGGVIKNVYVEGTMEAYTTECGGIVGATHQAITVQNVIANVTFNRPRSTDNRNNNGGFIGNIYDAPSIKDSISIGNMIGFTTSDGTYQDVYKFVGCDITKIPLYFKNNYEYLDATGKTSVSESTKGFLDAATNTDIHGKAFYKDILHFDETIWDFNSIKENGYPKLK